jgi:hypothetical protein
VDILSIYVFLAPFCRKRRDGFCHGSLGGFPEHGQFITVNQKTMLLVFNGNISIREGVYLSFHISGLRLVCNTAEIIMVSLTSFMFFIIPQSSISDILFGRRKDN